MPESKAKRSKTVRRSISLRSELDHRVQTLARTQNSSTNRIVESLIEAGLDAKEAEKRRFFEVAERFRSTTDPKAAEQMKAELARMVFGE